MVAIAKVARSGRRMRRNFRRAGKAFLPAEQRMHCRRREFPHFPHFALPPPPSSLGLTTCMQRCHRWQFAAFPVFPTEAIAVCRKPTHYSLSSSAIRTVTLVSLSVFERKNTPAPGPSASSSRTSNRLRPPAVDAVLLAHAQDRDVEPPHH